MIDDPLTSTAEESASDQPSFVSSTQIHKEIRCVELDFVVANQKREKLPLIIVLNNLV